MGKTTQIPTVTHRENSLFVIETFILSFVDGTRIGT